MWKRWITLKNAKIMKNVSFFKIKKMQGNLKENLRKKNIEIKIM